ncbi:hypothetical protein WMY93_021438 [Mugilogobius chulae]|uniref:Uncharacterized protein n=1 Tax=Mugilogobius chulae TaxID=88201 RepID=A0AAW0NHW4_9GOBI
MVCSAVRWPRARPVHCHSPPAKENEMELRSEYSAWQTMSALPRSSISFSDVILYPITAQPITWSSHRPFAPFSLLDSGLNSKEQPEFLFADSSCSSLSPHRISQPSTSPAPPQKTSSIFTTTSV